MIIEERNNGIIDIYTGIIAHQVNCCNKMNAGVAKLICEYYPIVKTTYHNYCNNHNIDTLFGSIQIVSINDFFSIANIFSQKFYGNPHKTGQTYTNMKVLTDCLKTLMGKNPDKTVYVPDHIGCGLGGGNWNEFCEIMKNTNLHVVKLKNS